MSGQPVKRGTCDAIFSTYRMQVNKENKPPERPTASTNRPDVFTLRATKEIEVDAQNVPQKPDSKISQNEDPQKTSNATPSKFQTPSKPQGTARMAVDRTPTHYFFTPKREKNVKLNDKSTPLKTPRRRFFNDPTAAQSTPEYFGPVQLSTPVAKREHAIDEMTVCEGETSNLTVGVRVRPISSRELHDSAKPIVSVSGTQLTVDCEAFQHVFSYDHCFTSEPQAAIFRSMVVPLVDSAFEGYNVCLFAYGQTGSGKSYSMMGPEVNQLSNFHLPDEAGIIPRFCHEIFTRAASNRNMTVGIEISYFEIYNEKIHDLLTSNVNASEKKRAPLRVREHPAFGPYVVDLSQHCIQNYEDLQVWLKVGNSQKATAATEMNEKSSRSHSIFSIVLTQSQKHVSHGTSGPSVTSEFSKRSKINLVDLAGSERPSQAVSGDRLREGVSINKSLLTLGKVIASLADNSGNRKRGFIPYRESILTWLLKESLGGNSKTAMLATVSPSSLHAEETLATLRYACQARSIVNRVRINEDPHDKLIRELKAEVLRLRGVREDYEKQLGPRKLSHSEIIGNVREIRNKEREIERLKSQLKQTERQLILSQKSWSDKLKEAEERKNLEVKLLRRCGIAVEISFRENITSPCLIYLTPDPILSGTLLYLIPPGIVRIGRNSEDCTKLNVSVDILLNGPLVSPLHCTIENNDEVLTLVPEANSNTYVNGQIVHDRVFLKHGDRLVIGGNHYFNVCNPKDKGKVSPHFFDYDFARQEILSIQEKRLRRELEHSKQRAIKELEIAKQEVELQLEFQKKNYENEIKCLGSTLKQQKLALTEIAEKKRELEIEREMLTHQIERSGEKYDSVGVEIAPYCSNFLPELEKLLNETTTNAKTTLTTATNQDAVTLGGITLYEMQLLVREANERCHSIGLNYEFSQQQIVTDKGLQPVIRVRDKDRTLETTWKPVYFLAWINRLRDCDSEKTIEELTNSADEWEIYSGDSADLERISINLTPVKKQLNESLHQLSKNGTLYDCTEKHQDLAKKWRKMKACLGQMENAAVTLGNLYHQYDGKEASQEVPTYLTDITSTLKKLSNALDSIHPRKT